ncbi:MAG: hypothetical protein GX489_09560 [Firmicutes bacterium]|nr:hypothetical protein [Bacillota bacterium]
MYLGIELITLVPLVLTKPAYIELFLSADKKVISSSFGKDEYIYPVVLAPNSRIAATGRKCLFLNHQRLAHLYQAGPTELIYVSYYESRKNFHLFLTSSLPLTAIQLSQDFCLNISTLEGSQVLGIDQTVVEHSGNGKFVIHLGTLRKTMDRLELTPY